MTAVDRIAFEQGQPLRSADLAALFGSLDLGLADHVRSAHHSQGVLIGLEPLLRTAPRRTLTVTPGIAATADGDLLVLTEPHTLVPGDAVGTVVLRAVGAGPRARPWLLGPHTAAEPGTDVVLGRLAPDATTVETTGLRTVARRPGTTQLLTGRLSQATAQFSGTQLCWSAVVSLPSDLAATPSVIASLDGPPPLATISTTIAVQEAGSNSFRLLVRHGRPSDQNPVLSQVTKATVDIVWTAVVDVPPVAVGPAPLATGTAETVALPDERAETLTVDEPTAPLPSVSRPAFFEHQVLAAADLMALVHSERALRELHHRTLHGWGIIRGIDVSGEAGSPSVTVMPGYALDAVGRELLLTRQVKLDVPAAAGDLDGRPGDPGSHAQEFRLVLRWTEDDEATVHTREGAGTSSGAVRLDNDPTLQWLPKKKVRTGFDLELATVHVQDCTLTVSPDPSSRRPLRVSPHVAAGATIAGHTEWTLVKTEGGSVMGLRTEIDTRSGGFTGSPTYLLRLEGLRSTPLPSPEGGHAVLDGTPYVESSAANSLVVVVPLHSGVTASDPDPADPATKAKAVQLNPASLLNDDLPALVGVSLGWSVAWVGVES
ncbi:hypothetical protein ABT330_06735 [Streptomyces sp. NPDC000658]|uniref:hypothetical protein n=1 Tax=Streptomyces sp. NPDC000658 TaxID=3154266 RepID=UPI003332B7B3